jgi:hypothetical protein
MTSDNVKEQYRTHLLVSALYKGKYQGTVWLDNKLVNKVDGTSIENVLTQLKSWVDQKYSKRIVPDAQTPAVGAFVDGFRRVMSRINDGQYAMLRAHFHARNRRLSPIDLASAANYQPGKVGGVNIWYGNLGQWIFEEMTAELDILLNEDGSPVYTSVLARYIDDPDNPDGHNVWEMRPEVAAAIEVLGLAN